MPVGPGTIYGGFRLFAKLFPAPPLDYVTSLPLEKLTFKYKWRDRWGNLIGFVLFVAVALGYYFLLVALAAWRTRGLERAVFLIEPIPFEWGFFAAFLSLTSSSVVGLLLLRGLLGRKEYEVYITYCSHRAFPPAPFDFTKVFKLFFVVGFLPLAAFVGLRIDSYTAFTEREMIDNPYWSVAREARIPYSSVRAIYEVQAYHARFKDVFEPHLLIAFNNGDRWRTDRGAKGLKLARQQRMVEYVAEKSERKIQQVMFVEDIPP
jgi:hypothetical protein